MDGNLIYQGFFHKSGKRLDSREVLNMKASDLSISDICKSANLARKQAPFFKDQFGFTDNLLKSMDEGHVSGAVYLDLKKAFDTLDYSLLLSKLTEYGVSELV